MKTDMNTASNDSNILYTKEDFIFICGKKKIKRKIGLIAILRQFFPHQLDISKTSRTNQLINLSNVTLVNGNAHCCNITYRYNFFFARITLL